MPYPAAMALDQCPTCAVLREEVTFLRRLVERQTDAPPPLTPVPPAIAAPATPMTFQDAFPNGLRDQHGTRYVITPDGTLDTEENYNRAMEMLDRQLSGTPSWEGHEETS